MIGQDYMPAYVEGKKDGMDTLASTILGELNAYAYTHVGESPPAPELYGKLIELCELAKKGESTKVYVVIDERDNFYAVYSAKSLAIVSAQVGPHGTAHIEEHEVQLDIDDDVLTDEKLRALRCDCGALDHAIGESCPAADPDRYQVPTVDSESLNADPNRT